MKNSSFQKEYNKLILEQKQYLISQNWLGDLAGSVIKPVVGLGKAGVSLVKGDMKGAGQGIKDVLMAPADAVKAVATAPIEMTQGAIDVVKNQLADNPEAQKKVDEAAAKVLKDKPQVVKQWKLNNTKLEKIDDKTVAKAAVVTTMAQNVQQKAAQKKPDDKAAKKAAAKAYRLKCKKNGLKFIWRLARKGQLKKGLYTIQL